MKFRTTWKDEFHSTKIGGGMCASTYWNKNIIKQKFAESNVQFKPVNNEIKQRVIKCKHKKFMVVQATSYVHHPGASI